MASRSGKTILAGQHQSVLERTGGRLIFLGLFFSLCFLTVGYRLLDLTVMDAGRRESATELAAPSQKGMALRADIVDRNGMLLATSLKTASLYADPTLIDDAVKTAEDLVSVLPNLNYGETLKRLQSKKRFVWLERNLTPRQHYQVNALGHPGLKFKFEDRRMYPQGSATAHVVGYTDVDGNGLAGIERSFDRLLKETDEPLRLTLDVRVQHILKRELEEARKSFRAKAATGLIMDDESGEILAMISLPDFDPHQPGNFDSAAKFNRASLGVYEMGSIFKLFSTAAALESGLAHFSSRFDVREPLKIGRFSIRDFHPEKRIMTLPEVFIHSSNIGSALMAEKLGTEKLKLFFQTAGLMDAAKIEIGEVGRPLIPTPWREVNTLTAAYGHGLAVSPVQVATAASAMVNGGILPHPTLILRKKTGKTAEKSQNINGTRIISPQTSYKLRQLMQLAVTEGTGTMAAVDGYIVGGKTGTAEKPQDGSYSKNALLASFLGTFPMDDPRYVVLIILDEPRGSATTHGYATGGWTAAPVFSRVVAEIAPLLGIPPERKKNQADIRQAMRRYLTKDKSLASY